MEKKTKTGPRLANREELRALASKQPPATREEMLAQVQRLKDFRAQEEAKRAAALR